MDDCTLRLPGRLREQLAAEAGERGVSVEEHVVDILEAHCAGTIKRPDLDITYTHLVLPTSEEEPPDDPDRETIASFRYGPVRS